MPCSNLRFLVVEDHPVQRRLVVTLLRSLGAAVVHEAQDGNEALEVTRDPARAVDIIITDISMPGMDGMELMRNIATAASPVSIILNSALTPAVLASVANMALAYGVQLLGVISKPISAVKLVPLVDMHRHMLERSGTHRYSLADIAGGLSRDEFEPLYAPIADLATAEVLGVQAIAHWQRPGQDALGPADFLSCVQAYGLADNLAWTCLAKTARHAQAWTAQGRSIRLSVSLPSVSLADPDVGRRAERAVREAGLDPAAVTLAVPATVASADKPITLETLARIRVAGFGLALEDFGTTDLSAAQLARMPLTELQLSEDLLRGGNPSARAELVVALDTAQELGLPVVARGLRSLDDWNLLQGWGCTAGQGSFVAPPMPADDVPGWLHGRANVVGAVGAMGKPLEIKQPR